MLLGDPETLRLWQPCSTGSPGWTLEILRLVAPQCQQCQLEGPHLQQDPLRCHHLPLHAPSLSICRQDGMLTRWRFFSALLAPSLINLKFKSINKCEITLQVSIYTKLNQDHSTWIHWAVVVFKYIAFFEKKNVVYFLLENLIYRVKEKKNLLSTDLLPLLPSLTGVPLSWK